MQTLSTLWYWDDVSRKRKFFNKTFQQETKKIFEWARIIGQAIGKVIPVFDKQVAYYFIARKSLSALNFWTDQNNLRK